MKLNETIDDTFTSHGIFYSLYSNNLIDWLTEDEAVYFDMEYYNLHSGNKNISVIYQRLLDNANVGSPLLHLAKIISAKYNKNWAQLRLAILGDYNPIENYSMLEVETPNLEVNITSNSKSKMTVETQDDNYGFNSADSQPIAKNVSTTSGDANDNENTSSSKSTGNRTLNRSGNVGVTTSQQMIESEILLREKNFADIIYDDVDTILCSPLYD